MLFQRRLQWRDTPAPWGQVSKMILPIALVLFFGACAGKPVIESDPASVFEDAEVDLKADRYQVAIDKFRTVKNKFPYSKYSTEAQLRIADAYFLQESFGEAAISYETFRDLHPRHEKAAYAQFRVAKSYFKDMPSTVARDHASATRALEAYNEFLAKHPTDKDADEAKKDVRTIRESLAQKEIYIGDFYRRLNRPEAAAPRYKKAADQYPDTEAALTAQERHKKSEAEIAKRAIAQP